MEAGAAVAALEAAVEKTAGAASAAKEAAVAAWAAAADAEGVVTAKMEAAMAAFDTAVQAAAASSTQKQAAVAAEADAKQAEGVATAKMEAAMAALATAVQAAAASSTKKQAAMAAEAGATEAEGVATAKMEAAMAAEAGATEAEGVATAAKEAAVAASAAATNAAGAATAAKEAAMAALATAEQAAASSTAKEAAMAAEAAAAATVKELAAAMRYSKKRTFHQIDDEGTGGGERGEGESLDLISALPDDVLGTIISRLPTKDGARTQAISRRWRPLWRLAPLNLEVEFEGRSKNRKLIARVSKILSQHRGHARRLSLQYVGPTNVPVRGWERKIDGWLRSQALDSLQELDFSYSLDMPLSVFRFAPTLCFAKFSHCNFPESISTMSLNFPCLKELTLYRVTITEDGLHSMLSGCTALESLELKEIYGISGLCISSQTLRSLAFSAGYLLTLKTPIIMSDLRPSRLQLVIKDAPCLERLLPFYTHKELACASIRVIWAPKLEILGVLSESISVFQFGTTIFQKMIPVSLTTEIRTMKILVLDSIGPNLDTAVDFLKCFPCLVTLYVISHPTKDMNNARMYNQDPIECLELHLKKVVLMNYDGSKRPSVDFAKFFILNTKLLKEMRIEVVNNRNDEWMANQHRQLFVESRASRGARIELKKCISIGVNTHDLSRPDPFDNRSFSQ